MKTLLITEQFPPLVGGAATYFYNLYTRLKPEDVVVYTKKRKNAKAFDMQQKIKIIRGWIWQAPFSLFRPTAIIGPLWLLYSILKYARKEKIDIIHCGYVYPFGGCGLLIKKLFKIPYVVYAFGEEIGHFKLNRFKRRVIVAVLKNADAVIALSENTKALIANLGINKERIIKITAGVDLEKFKIDKETIFAGAANLRDKKMLLTVARLAERKGQDVVIKALPRVLEKFPNTVYIIAGGGNSEQKLKALARQLGLEDKVIFLGEVPFDKVHKYYNICNIFIMVNRLIPEEGDMEGFGIVFLEAGAYGKPVIGGRSGGVPEAVDDGVTGILINNPLDEDEVGTAILRLLTNEEGANKMGRAGRERAEKLFSWQEQVDKIPLVNKKILREHGTG